MAVDADDASADSDDASARFDDASADSDDASARFDRTELARMAGLPLHVVDSVIGAGLLAPLGLSRADRADGGIDSAVGEDESFGSDAVDMLSAARTFVSEGVAMEELAALAMRHAANVEAVIDDAIDLCKRHVADRGLDRAQLAAVIHRLVPVATELVAGHFERTLATRALSRIDGRPAAAGSVIVCARRLEERVDPLAVYAAADPQRHRMLWLRPSAGFGVAAVGVVEAIEASGKDRFSVASAVRVMLEARVLCRGPDEAPSPVLLGGFSFSPRGGSSEDGGDDHDESRIGWPAGFGDCRLVLPELTVVDRTDGTWVMAAGRVGFDGEEEAVRERLEQQITDFAAQRFLDFSGPFDEQVPIVDGRSAGLPGDSISSVSSPGGCSGVCGDCGDCSCVDGDCGDYLDLVASAVDAIHRGEFRKVVLSRTASVEADLGDSVAMRTVLARLRESNPDCAVFAFATGQAVFFGATPEELATIHDTRIQTTALAGTAARGDTTVEDEQLATELLASSKDRSEHRFVVDGIAEALTGLGLMDTAVPEQPDLMRLMHLQHLRTRITARARQRHSRMSDMDVLRVAGALHPTPAVGGSPTHAALTFIAEHEGFDRGWYAAPVGWCDLSGNGELWVALRCGLAVSGAVRLFAGAGIVEGSVPAAELRETAVKFRSLLDAVCGYEGVEPVG